MSFAKLHIFSPLSISRDADIAKAIHFRKRMGMKIPLDQPQDGGARTCFVELVLPEHANHYGTLFGGNALALMSKAAFVAATRRARRPIVMAASDKVEFHGAVRVGELLEFTAFVERVGRSSMTVVVDAVAEALVTGHRRPAVSGSFEMVAVDVEGKPVPIDGSFPSQSPEDIPS